MIKLSRLQKVLWAAALTALAVYAGATVMLDPDPAGSSDPLPSSIMAEFGLTDHLGQARDDEDFEGKWLLVFFGFTNCPDICPVSLATMANVMEGLGDAAEKVQPLFISVDPERDTPEAMAGYVSAFGPAIIGLTGSTDEVAEAAGNFRAYFEKIDDATAPDGYTMGHSSSIYLINPMGRFVDVYGLDESPEEIVTDLAQKVRS